MSRLLNISSEGFGLETQQPLAVGAQVSVTGELVSHGSRIQIKASTRVAYCTLQPSGSYRVGLSMEEFSSQQEGPQSDSGRQAPPAPDASNQFTDYYEVLQVSPSAELETIHRVYRMLAQRHHPDNGETGNEEAFKLLLRAYRVLSDPEQRAAYDLRHRAACRLRWKIFDQPKAAEGVEGEKSKRRGILSLLYTKRVNQPEQPGVTMMEFEELLGCPREHLECSLWYLREKGLLTRSDNGRYLITAQGFDAAEASGVFEPARPDRLLTTAQPHDPVEQAQRIVDEVMTPA